MPIPHTHDLYGSESMGTTNSSNSPYRNSFRGLIQYHHNQDQEQEKLTLPSTSSNGSNGHSSSIDFCEDSNSTESFNSATINTDTTATAKDLRHLNGGSGFTVPTGLKVVSLVSMVTAITLIAASSFLLYRSNETLIAFLKAAPATISLLTQVNTLFGGTASIVDEVQSQEKYLRILIMCSAILIATGIVQLICNLWFFFRMNAPCVTRCISKTDEFFCGH